LSTPILEGEKGVWLTRCSGPEELLARLGSRTCFDVSAAGGDVRLNREQAELVVKTLQAELEKDA
jgi:hypothetical protein